MTERNRCNSPLNDCNQPCDPCKKQVKMYYCGVDIDCLGIDKGDELSSALQKIGAKVCQMVGEANPLTYVTIEDALLEDCAFGGYTFKILQVGTDNIVGTYTLCNGAEITPQEIVPVLTVELMTAGDLSFNPIYDNGTDGVGATLTATANGVLRDNSGVGLIDSVSTPIAGTIIWVKNRANAIENGPYEITVRGDSSTQYVLTRPEDYNELPELYPLQINVLFGNVNKNTVWLQKTIDPEIGVDPIVVELTTLPQFSPIRFIDTATSEPLPAFTYNQTDKTITFDSVGYFGNLNGCFATLQSNIEGGFRTFLVKDEIDNPEYNGTYAWLNVGSSIIAPKAVRLDAFGGQFSKNSRMFVVSNSFSTLYGKQYCVEPISPPLTTAGIGTQPINFVPFVGTFPTLQQVSDTGGLSNGSTIRQGSFNRFGLNGIETVCSEDKRIQFANGIEYYYPYSDGVITYANSMNSDIPDSSYDETQGFRVGAFFNSLALGMTYICIDQTEGSAVWLPMGGEYFPTLDGVSGAITAIALGVAFYNINNGICEVSIQGNVDIDFSILSEGNFHFTLPLPTLSPIIGVITLRTPYQCNGFIYGGVSISSNDTSFVVNAVPFVAKFTYQTY